MSLFGAATGAFVQGHESSRACSGSVSVQVAIQVAGLTGIGKFCCCYAGAVFLSPWHPMPLSRCVPQADYACIPGTSEPQAYKDETLNPSFAIQNLCVSSGEV